MKFLKSLIFFSPFFSVVSELIHFTASQNAGGLSSQIPLIHVLIPHIMDLMEPLQDSAKVLEFYVVSLSETNL